MDELIVRSLQGRGTPEEGEHLRAWRAREAENEKRYRSVRERWSLADTATPKIKADLPAVDALIARAETERKADIARTPSPVLSVAPRSTGPRSAHSRPSSSRWGRRAAAGALAAGLVAIGFGVEFVVDDEKKPTLRSDTEIVTGAEKGTTLTLGDGSSIRLGPQSRLRLAEEKGHRMAWLEGRAFFGIQADSKRPFTVHTAHGEAQVLGTRLEVRSEEGKFRVLVVEGRVSVAAGDEEGKVLEGEMARVDRGGQLSTKRVHDVYHHMDWIGNTVVFQATPLKRALREIERRYGVKITLEDPALAEFTITATLTDRPIEQAIFVLCESVNTTCAIDDERIRIGTA